MRWLMDCEVYFVYCLVLAGRLPSRKCAVLGAAASYDRLAHKLAARGAN